MDLFNNLNKRYAIIFPGNLASYFLCIEQLKLLCNSKNIDFYILYSNKINYCHTDLHHKNINFPIDDSDLSLINNFIGTNIKYFKCIEETNDYDNEMEESIQKFLKNIEWIKNDSNQVNNFNYDSFQNKIRTKKYLDQFVRIYYLYKKIKQSNINYDYILRFRIDHFYEYNTLYKIFQNLEINNPVNLYKLDCIFAIRNDFFNFFTYMIDNLGSFKNDRNDYNYKIGPEPQFELCLKNFFNNKINFIPCEITFSLFKDYKQYTYSSYLYDFKPFSKYITENNITIDNFEIIFQNNKHISIYDHNYKIPEKYLNFIFAVYTIANK